MLKQKFIPMILRSKVWKSFALNQASITVKMYQLYKESLDKIVQQLPSGTPYASQQIIMGALKVCETALGVTVDQQTLESTTKLVMIFEYFHPEVGFILGTEKLAFLLRILMRL